jgi:thiol-disulfide isomerase/thioredoxin
MFICNHCPFVVHVLDEIISISEEYFKDISFIAISSNDIINYPEDSPKLMKKLAIDKQFTFPYLYDENQEVAKKYDAACTPDFFLYDKNKKLVYRGQLDDSRPGNNIPVTGKDLRSAIVSLIEGKEIDKNQKPSIGCNIKWI